MPKIVATVITLFFASQAIAAQFSVGNLPPSFCAGAEEGISDGPIFRANRNKAITDKCLFEFSPETKTYHSEAVVMIDGAITKIHRTRFEAKANPQTNKTNPNVGRRYLLQFFSQSRDVEVVLTAEIISSSCKAKKVVGCDTDACACGDNYSGALTFVHNNHKISAPVVFSRGSEHGAPSVP